MHGFAFLIEMAGTSPAMTSREVLGQIDRQQPKFVSERAAMDYELRKRGSKVDVSLVMDDTTAVRQRRAGNAKNVLVIDIGGTSVKLLATGQPERRRFPSGPKMTPGMMVKKTIKLVADWPYSAVSIGYP